MQFKELSISRGLIRITTISNREVCGLHATFSQRCKNRERKKKECFNNQACHSLLMRQNLLTPVNVVTDVLI